MRSKEDAHDYRYFPEPDLPPLLLDPSWIEQQRAALPELPEARRQRFVTEYGLPAYDAGWLTQSAAHADFFEATARASGNAKLASNWIMGELARLTNERGDAFDAQPVSPDRLAGLIALVAAGTISHAIAKPVFEKMYTSGRTADEIVAAEGLAQVDDEGAVLTAVRDVIEKNTETVAQYRGGRVQTFGFLVGQVMKASGGKANPKLVKALLERELGAPPRP